MYMMFNNTKIGWSLGIMYENPAVPEHLKLFLSCQEQLDVKTLTNWLIAHEARAVMYCLGNPVEKLRTLRIRNQFNTRMKRGGFNLDLMEFAKEVNDNEGADKNT